MKPYIRPNRFDYVPVAIVSYGIAYLIGVATGVGICITLALLKVLP